MGIGKRIRAWFHRVSTGETQVQAVTLDKPARSEADELLEEFKKLNAERNTLRQELTDIDDKFTMGQLQPTEHDKEYRTRLARAGQIRLRQMEIRSRLAELGSPLPESQVSAG
jgi:predicted  nucleic acid-binding Zn-ribbon protein